MGWMIVLGTVPIVVLGLTLKKHIESTFRSLYVISGSLIGLAIVLAIAEYWLRRRQATGIEPKQLENVTFVDAAIIGLAQAVALVPGFGLTNRIMIDQHFRQRDRLGRLLTALAYNPFAVGVGLDEDTAAFIDHDRKLTVVGAGALTIIDASELSHSSIAEAKLGRPVSMTNIRLHVLIEGGTFDLERRKASVPGL